MQRWMNLVLFLVLGLMLASPAAAADPAVARSGRVLIAVGGDLVVPVGEQADTAIVVSGHLSVLGTVSNVVVIDGTATITGTTIESLLVVRGSAEVTGTHVLKDIRTFDAQVSQTAVTLDGGIRGLETDLVALGWAFGVGALLIWLGIGLATLVAGLAIAGLAGRQLRATAAIIRREPLLAVGGGILGLVVPPILALALVATIVGIPLAVSVVLFVWPTMAFIGYIVAAAWLGTWALGWIRGPAPEPERPYAATVVGLVLLFIAGIIPLLTAILSFLGFGAVVIAAWRTVRGVSAPTLIRPTPAPMAG